MPIALVTGGSRGIGSGIVRKLEASGWQVLAPDRRALDLGNSESIEAFLDSLPHPPYGLVLSAGVNTPRPFVEVSRAEWDEIHEVNVAGAVQLLQGIVPLMVAEGGGRIVAVSSLYATRARHSRAPYSASKAALEAVVRTVAVEFGLDGVLANCVAPGFVDTDMTRRNNSAEVLKEIVARIPVGRLLDIDDVSRAVTFLLSPDNTAITGQTLVVDGGFSIT